MKLVKKVSDRVSIYFHCNEFVVLVKGRFGVEYSVSELEDAEYHADTVELELQNMEEVA